MPEGYWRAGLLMLGIVIAVPTAANPQRVDPKPLDDMATWIGPDDYPPAAIRARQQGKVVASLAIDAQGTVTGCSIAASSNSAALDARTCEVMMRPGHRFSPARDEQGKAVAGVFPANIMWALPVDDGTMGPVVTSGTSFRLTIGPDGAITHCEAAVVPDGYVIDAEPICAQMGASIVAAAREAGVRNDARRIAVLVLVDTVIGNDPPPTGAVPADMTLLQHSAVRYVVRPDGRLDDCFRVTIFGPPAEGPMPCEEPMRHSPAQADRSMQQIYRIAYRYLEP